MTHAGQACNQPAGDILVVDDTPANLHLLSRMLQQQGYKVRSAPNGKLALMGARATPPDLILLDINLPDLDGYQVCEQIRCMPHLSAVPIIFISALDQIEDKVRAFRLGGVDYITKPFQMEEVLARVQTHLTLRRLQTELAHANASLAHANASLAHANASLAHANAGLEKRVAERTAELMQLNVAAQCFVPGEFLCFLHRQSIADARLGDQVQAEMTVLFSDIVAFTSLSECMTPQENFNYLNAYLGYISPIVRQHHGFIDKYLGDGVMAIFPHCAADALQAAIAMQRQVAQYSAQTEAQGLPALNIGIGLHTGKVMLGIIGEDHRWQGTVISDAVNLAARLEDLTRTYNAQILLSEQTVQHLGNPEQYPIDFLARLCVKGKQEWVNVYKVCTAR